MNSDTPTPQRTEPLTEPVVILEKVTVAYRQYQSRPTSLKESIIRMITKRQFRHYSTFNALDDVSFSLNGGEVLGIIGSNGSGKSTLLRVLSGVLVPTLGSVSVNGSIGSLIELGAGFDPELNAEENIYLNGALHRRSRAEMRQRIDSIIEFAELGDFRFTPVKYYSAGMFARLGFGVATDLEPDLLLVDEVLAVGDERFQEKCQSRIKSLIEAEKTVILVSHSMAQIAELCDRAMLLSKGRLSFIGDPQAAIDRYRDSDYESRLAS